MKFSSFSHLSTNLITEKGHTFSEFSLAFGNKTICLLLQDWTAVLQTEMTQTSLRLG